MQVARCDPLAIVILGQCMDILPDFFQVRILSVAQPVIKAMRRLHLFHEISLSRWVQLQLGRGKYRFGKLLWCQQTAAKAMQTD